MDYVKILDTTLRDGDQAAGVAFIPAQKLAIAEQLDGLGVDILEVGFPAASSTEFASVRSISSQIREKTVSAFARGIRSDIELAAEALRPAQAPRIEVAVPVSDIHISGQLGKNRMDALDMTRNAVRIARNLIGDVQWIGVDATRADRTYLAQHMEAAIAEGASTVTIADTVGYTSPVEIDRLVRYLKAEISGAERALISVHCHDDLGLATANTLAALCAGAREAQCTVNGVGERAGNAALEEIVMAAKTRPEIFSFEFGIDATRLTSVSRTVERMSGFVIPPNKPIVGSNVFSHGSGLHQDALLKDVDTYQLFHPEVVGGDKQEFVIGPHSGRNGLRFKLEELGIHLEERLLDDAITAVKAMSLGRKNLTDDDLAAIVQRLWRDGTR